MRICSPIPDENATKTTICISRSEEQRIRDLTPFLGIPSEQILLAPARPGEVLVSMNLRDSKVFDVYRVIWRRAQR